MSFEEEFPSLKEYMYEDIMVRSVLNHRDLQEILSKHCLDKQRVKEAIMRLPDDNRRHILLKELGIK